MRFLRRDDKQLDFHSPSESNPSEPYAILSHTWGKEKDEVTYKDICDGTLAKPGYDKIDFCLREASRNGLQNVWIDTCCINQYDRNEVGEAINLMFEYYSKAAVCFVYLADTPYQRREEIASSRWFTRGWTLQELVAAPDARFFSSDYKYLGDKKDLAGQILAHGINILQPLQEVSLVQRFKWSLSRKTTKPEDGSYCLVGLMEVRLNHNYGEGPIGAQERLIEAIKEEHGRKVSRAIEEAIILYRLERPAVYRIKESLKPENLMDSLVFGSMDSRRINISEPFSDSCDWLLSHPAYRDWKEMAGKNRLLWIKGNPGSGKSVLVKFAHSRSRAEAISCISFFFNARGSLVDRTVKGLYSSLLYQLLKGSRIRQAIVVNELASSYNHQNPSAWSLGALQHALIAVVKSLTEKVQCFVDALDECKEDEIQDMVDLFQDLALNGQQFHVCFASRYYPTISIGHSVEICVEQQKDHSAALKDYVRDKLMLNDLDPEKQNILRAQILFRAKGIFLWVVLVVQLLNHELQRGQGFNLNAQLSRLPNSLNELFSEIVSRMSTDSEIFRLSIYWILFSRRVLTSTHYYHAMVTSLTDCGLLDSADYSANMREKPASSMLGRYVASSSRGLAQTTSNGMVEFIHESVRDFLLTYGGLKSLNNQAVSGDLNSCIHDQLKTACHRMLDIGYDIDDDISFSSNKELSVIYHAERAAQQISQDGFIMSLRHMLKAAKKTSSCDWHELLVANDASRLIRLAYDKGLGFEKSDSRSLIFLAASRPSLDILRTILACGADVRNGPADRISAIMWAATAASGPHSRFTLTQTLLEHGADVEMRDKDGFTCLMNVALLGDEQIVDLLINHGANIEAVDRNSRTALVQAIDMRRLDVIELLLQRGANPNVLDTAGIPILLSACMKKQSMGWNIKAWLRRKNDTQTLLRLGKYRASGTSNAYNLIILWLLIRHNAKLAFQHEGTTALVEASQAQCVAGVVMLLEAGADPNEKDALGRTALLYACQRGGEQVVRALLDYRASVDVGDKEGNTPLKLASQIGDRHILDLLNSQDAEPAPRRLRLGIRH